MNRLIIFGLVVLLSSCSTHITLVGSDGSRVEYSGAKIFTNTSVALSSGPGCKVPADPNAPVTPATAGTSDTPSGKCTTQVATIAGVNVAGLTSTILSAAIAIIAMIATAT